MRQDPSRNLSSREQGGGSPDSAERGLSLREIADHIGERNVKRVEQMLLDAGERQVLAHRLFDVKAVRDRFGDISALNERLLHLTKTLTSKKGFLERVKEGGSWVWNKSREILSHPLVKWPLIILVAYFGLSKLLDWLKKANLDQAIAQNNTISEVAKAGKRLIQAPQLTAPGSGVVGGAGGPVGGRGAIVTPHSEG